MAPGTPHSIEAVEPTVFRIQFAPDADPTEALVGQAAAADWGLYQLKPEQTSLEENFNVDRYFKKGFSRGGRLDWKAIGEHSRSLISDFKILAQSPQAIAGVIRSVLAGLDEKQDGFKTEIEEFGKCFGTDEFKEGVSAFLEKRKPEFGMARS